MYDLTTGEVIAQYTHGKDDDIPISKAFVFSVAFSPDGETLAFHPNGQHLLVWDWQRGWVDSIRLAPEMGGRVVVSHFLPEGQRLLAVNDNMPVVVDLSTKTVDPGMATSLEPYLSASPNGQLLASADIIGLVGGRVMIHESATGKELLRLPLDAGATPVFAPDGRHLAVPLRNGTVAVLRLYDPDGSRRLFAACDAVLQRDPRNREALHQRGRLSLKFKQPDRAINAFSRLIALDPKDARAWLGRGLAHADRDDIVRARHDVEQALRLDPQLAGLAGSR